MSKSTPHHDSTGMSTTSNLGLLQSIFTRHWLAPEAIALWTDEASLRAWVEVELALAQAQSDPAIGLIPEGSHLAMRERIRLEDFDLASVQTEIAHTAHPFVPVLHQLEGMLGDELAGYLHWGATTQNIFDTADAWRLKQSHEMLMPYLSQTLNLLADLALKHKNTPQAGRTHGQHALPITFGFKLAAWRAELRRHHDRLSEAAPHCFWAMMGGAVGTFSAMQGKGQLVQQAVAKIMGLTSMDIPMRSSSDGFAHYASLLGLLAATTEKIAREIIFMQRTEIAEVGESFHRGKVGSSTMSQKRNPQAAMNLVTISRLLRSRAALLGESIIQQDEGDASSGNIVGVVLPELAILGVSVACGLQTLLAGLEVDADAMKRHLHISDGLIVSEAVMMALASHLGRHTAHKVLYDVAHDSQDSGKSFLELIASHPSVKPLAHQLQLAELLNPENYLGESAQIVDREIQRQAKATTHD
jgi:adenylosuccinate lyase